MNDLKVFDFEGQNVTDSRLVAEMLGMRHSDLLEKIKKYEAILANGKFRSPNFFIPSTYKDAQDKERPCYLLTKKGCEMVANKLTGEKGVLFTATYVEAFNQMEQRTSLPTTYKQALQELLLQVEENEKLQLENKVQSQQIAELKPKADYTDDILKNKGLVTITAIAKDYGLSGTTMNAKLHKLGVQYKQSGQWFLYSKHQDKGYTHSETQKITHSDGRQSIKMNTKWTQKGRLFIYELLKSNGILPTIEREENTA